MFHDDIMSEESTATRLENPETRNNNAPRTSDNPSPSNTSGSVRHDTYNNDISSFNNNHSLAHLRADNITKDNDIVSQHSALSGSETIHSSTGGSMFNLFSHLSSKSLNSEMYSPRQSRFSRLDKARIGAKSRSSSMGKLLDYTSSPRHHRHHYKHHDSAQAINSV
jgi:hypothetical protein